MSTLPEPWDLVSTFAPAEFTKFAIDKARQRGRIPHKWRLPILRRAREAGLAVPDDYFDSPSPERAGKAA